MTAVLQLALITAAFAQSPIVQDEGIVISDKEFEYLVTRWTKQMRDVAIQDEGDRLELINLALANKKIARQADEVAQQNPDVLWQYQLGLEAYQRDFVLRQYRDSLQVPDFSELAQEQYTVNREKNAAIPERRISSHILFVTKPGMPGDAREKITADAQSVLDQLRAGADFVEMVKQYSGEPGAAVKEGKFDKWVQYGEVGVSPPYSEGLFTIASVGEYSELVQTQFGLHIIRLDGIQEKSFKSFDEVKADIVQKLEAEYVKLAMKEWVGRFQMTNDAVIDSEAVESILAPYAKQE
ncbi:MAG: peptidylprolyl isomerase [Halioglobus sp.]